MKIDDFIISLKQILNDDCIEKLRIVDPRVQHYELYVKLNDLDVKKVLDIYPDAEIEYSLFKKIKKISTKGIKSFTIYNVSGEKRKK